MQDRQSIRFLLGSETRVLTDVLPTTTVLEYLRKVERMTGTKEGCAVVIAEDENGKLRYKACNSCIMFVPFLHGKQLITVEHLKDRNEQLHPVQQAMVDQHGSQCGFCTPGFVMSLFGMYHNGCDTNRAAIDDALAGNLCRCTGYAPIVRAARQALHGHHPDQFDHREKHTLRSLSDLDAAPSVHLDLSQQSYYAPATVKELKQILKEKPESRIVAGATDVGLWVTKERKHLDCVISVSDIQALQSISIEKEMIRIGSAVTIAAAMDTLSLYYPSLDELFRRYGSVQVRNQATIGGNVANGSPIGDSLPVLIALDAKLIISSATGSRTLPAEDYFIDYGRQDLRPGEFLERIDLPLPVEGQHFRVYKLSKRFHQDISAVCGAFSVTLNAGIIQTVRISFGGMAATPRRAFHCEEALIGSPISGDVIDRGLQALQRDFTPITDFRGNSDYRTRVAGNLLERLFDEISGHERPIVWEADCA